MENPKGQSDKNDFVNRPSRGEFILLSLAVVACIFQFKVSNVIPLTVATVLFGLAGLVSPAIRKTSLGLFLGVVLFLWVDISLLHHRVAVWSRVSLRFLDSSAIEQVLSSPSGRTVVYVVGEHWLDSRYKIFVSDGGLFPKMANVPKATNSESERPHVKALWTGEVFEVAAGGETLRYSEKNRTFELQTPVVE